MRVNNQNHLLYKFGKVNTMEKMINIMPYKEIQGGEESI